jgi:hypothetical protein
VAESVTWYAAVSSEHFYCLSSVFSCNCSAGLWPQEMRTQGPLCVLCPRYCLHSLLMNCLTFGLVPELLSRVWSRTAVEGDRIHKMRVLNVTVHSHTSPVHLPDLLGSDRIQSLVDLRYSRVSLVGITTSYWLESCGSSPPLQRPDRLWGSPTLPHNVYIELVILTTHIR